MNTKTKAIKNAQIVLENGIIWDGIILIEGNKIISYGDNRSVAVPEGAEIIDAEGAYVGPGFVDIHVHFGGSFSTATDPIEAAKECLKHGATSILATPSYNMNFEKLMAAIKIIKESMPYAKTIKGIYSEGPYINPIFGAYSYKNPWRHPIDEKEYKAFVNEAGSLVKVWTIAPEREGVLEFLKYARSVNPDVVFSLGHSMATPAEIRALGKYKPKILTHAMNATGRREVPAGTRGCGPDEYCFKENDMYAELISDSCGIHVSSELQNLLIHTKGIDKVILITDCTYYENPSPENLSHITDLNFDENGDLAGSKLTMDKACKNVMASTGCGIAQAFKMASTNPSRAIGIDDEVGAIECGKVADLVFTDDKFNVKKVLLGGNICKF